MQIYFLYDGLASTTGLTEGGENMTHSYVYDVLGALRSHARSSPNEWLFTGELQDQQVSRQLF